MDKLHGCWRPNDARLGCWENLPGLAAGAQCSMDGRGRCLDNVFIERLWRSLKYEAVYLHELVDGFEAEQVIGTWMTFYSDVRPHSALGGRTPAEAYGEERAA